MTLLELAERCEEAREPAFEGMFAEAFEAIHGGRSSIGARWSAFCALTEADAWLDAAMMLVPDGWRPLIDGTPDDLAVAELFRESDCITPIERGSGRTLALALCAAALRTRSTQEGDDNAHR